MSLNVQTEGKRLCCFGAASLYPSLRCQDAAEFRSVGSSGLVWCAKHAGHFHASQVEKLLPRRIVLSRKKGWRLPPGTVKVDRTSRWGNPFRVGSTVHVWHPPGGGGKVYRDQFEVLDAAHAVRLFAHAMERDPQWYHDTWTVPDLAPLRGMDLACWCKEGQPCHADVLLEWANREEGKGK